MYVNGFIRRIDELKKIVTAFLEDLTNEEDIDKLNITSKIKDIDKEIEKLNNDKNDVLQRLNVSEEDKKRIIEKLDGLKNIVIELKNKQIYEYNLKVEYINTKIRRLKRVSSLVKNDDISNLKQLRYCNDYLHGDWKKNSYQKKLDYDRLREVYEEVSLLEKKYNVKNNEPIDLGIMINNCVELVKEVKRELNNSEITFNECDTLLSKCEFIYENIVKLDLDVRRYYDDGKINDILFASYNDKTTRLYDGFNIVKNKTLEKKNDVDLKSNDYTSIMNKLEFLEKETNILDDIISNCFGESDELNNRIRIYIDKINKELTEICRRKNLNTNLKSGQVKELDKKLVSLDKFLKEFENKMNGVEEGINIFSDVPGMLDKLELDLDNLLEKVNHFDKDNKDEVEEIKKLINKGKNDILNIDDILYGVDNEKLNSRFVELRLKYNAICNKYNKSSSLLVKSVRTNNVSVLYNKYHKECLECSGLASVALSEGAPLIPALMHMNMLKSEKNPKMNKFYNFINKVLGGIINARTNEKGEWFLSNGFKIGPSVAETALLKNVAMSDTGSRTLIGDIRELFRKIELRDKFKKGRENVRNLNKENNEKKQRNREGFYNKLYRMRTNFQKILLEQEYWNSPVKDIDEFCRLYGLSDDDKIYLKASVNYVNTNTNGRLKR